MTEIWHKTNLARQIDAMYQARRQTLMMGIATVFLCILLSSMPLVTSDDVTILTDNDTSRLLDKILNHTDPRIRPNVNGDAVNVEVGIFVVSFGSISEIDMDYSMDIYLRQHWTDERLRFKGLHRHIVITGKSIEKVWVPDLFFSNEKSAEFHSVTKPNQLMRIYPDGNITYSVRVTLTLSCPMVLTYFPMDRQECFMNMESYGYEERDMIFHWKDADAIEVNKEMQLPQFDLLTTEPIPCIGMYKTGNFSCLKAKFTLKRQFGFFLLQTYIPSILIVILSWVSFWINMDAVPARISLGVTTVLTMTTQLTGSRASIPRVSYPKAIDVWMAMCMIFVFGALLEYAFVNVLARRSDDKSQDPHCNGSYQMVQKGEQVQDEDDDVSVTVKDRCLSIVDRIKTRESAKKLDKVARHMFPATFFVFNIVYWAVYTRGG